MKREFDAKTAAIVEKYKLEGPLVRLSKTSKLGTFSWSLQALNTCPASIGENGDLVDACKGCYATRGQYNYSNVKAPRFYNDWAWRQDDFVNEFISTLEGHLHFRWFDSGDVYNLALAEKLYQIMKGTPDTKHWLPTRMYKFAKFHSILNKMAELENVCVRLSSDSIMGEIVNVPTAIDIDTSSTIIPDGYQSGFKKDGFFICKAPDQGGACRDCRACYSRDVSTIAYIGHGVSTVKNQAKKLALKEI